MKIMRLLKVFTVSSLFLIGCTEGPHRDVIAITNVTVINADRDNLEKQTVVFAEDQIISVEPTEEEISGVSRVIDGTGKYLIPGLWDMHVHLTYDDAFTEDMPSLFLAYGITSVRDTGGLIHKIKPVVERMRAEDAISPRVYLSLIHISEPTRP